MTGDVKLDLPYLYADQHRSGRTRYRVIRTIGGVTRKAVVHGEPGTPEFQEAYAAARRKVERPALVEAEEKDFAGYRHQSTGWLVGLFLAAMVKRQSAGLVQANTLARYRLDLNRLVGHRFVSDKHPNGIEVGDLHHELPRRVVLQVRDTLLDRPAAADTFMKTVSAMYRWALEGDEIDETVRNPAAGRARVQKKSEGHRPWELQHVQAWFKAYGPGTLQRLVMAQEVCTAARIGDLVAMGPHTIREEGGARWLKWRQEKPPHLEVEIPLLDLLADELALIRDGRPTWLGILDGEGEGAVWRPRSKFGLGNNFRDWRRKIGLPEGLSIHGVRKGIASILPTLGVSTYGIDVVLGHELGSKATQIYTAGAERRRIAQATNAEWSAIDWGG